MRNPICLLRTIWRSLRCGVWVMGHNYETDKEPTPPNVHVLRCRTCGSVSAVWAWDSIEHLK